MIKDEETHLNEECLEEMAAAESVMAAEREEEVTAYEESLIQGENQTKETPQRPKEQVALTYVENLLTNALRQSGQTEFSPVGFTYSDLEMMKNLLEFLVTRNNNVTTSMTTYISSVNQDKSRIAQAINDLKLNLDDVFSQFIGQINEKD